MKMRILLILLIGALLFESCRSAMTPYQAANNPGKSRKCRAIR